MSLKKQVGIKVVEGVKKYTGAALRGLGLSGKSKTVSGLNHPVIDRLKLKKNLKQRKTDQDEIGRVVDKHPSPNSPAIKKKYIKKTSEIHDKYEK